MYFVGQTPLFWRKFLPISPTLKISVAISSKRSYVSPTLHDASEYSNLTNYSAENLRTPARLWITAQNMGTPTEHKYNHISTAGFNFETSQMSCYIKQVKPRGKYTGSFHTNKESSWREVGVGSHCRAF